MYMYTQKYIISDSPKHHCCYKYYDYCYNDNSHNDDYFSNC